MAFQERFIPVHVQCSTFMIDPCCSVVRLCRVTFPVLSPPHCKYNVSQKLQPLKGAMVPITVAI